MSDLDLLRRIDAIERMLCQGHPEGVMCAICEARYSVPEPAPKPFAERHPLAEILERLAVLDEYSDTGVDETRLYQMNIARIVAVCEQQVGDGWQADPDVVPRGHWGIAWLLVPLSHEPPGWTMVGNRAAAWLRDLTEGGTA